MFDGAWAPGLVGFFSRAGLARLRHRKPVHLANILDGLKLDDDGIVSSGCRFGDLSIGSGVVGDADCVDQGSLDIFPRRLNLGGFGSAVADRSGVAQS